MRGRCIYKKIQYLSCDLDIGVKVTRDVAQYLLHHVTYAPTNFEVAMSIKVEEEMHLQQNTVFDLDSKVTQNIAQYSIHHVTYATAKFEFATSNILGGDAFTRKYSI